MNGLIQLITQKMKNLKEKLNNNKGMSVIELILILVGIFTPYYGVGIRCMA